jgi:uncharacterized protein
MKYLLVILVAVLVLWLMFGRRRVERSTDEPPPRASDTGAQAMLACTHCGLHVPRKEAMFDEFGRPYCGEAHRLAGPR